MKLYQTYKDSKCIYMITELIKGQELYEHMTEDGSAMDGSHHMFYAANVVLMFEALHQQVNSTCMLLTLSHFSLCVVQSLTALVALHFSLLQLQCVLFISIN